LLDLVTHYCRKPLIFKQLGGDGQLLLSLTAVRHAVLQQPNMVQQAPGAVTSMGAAASATASVPTNQQSAPARSVDKPTEVVNFRKAITEATKRANTDIANAKKAQQRVEDIKAKSTKLPNNTLNIVNQTRPKLDEQAQRASKVSGEKAERVKKMIASARAQVDEMENRANKAKIDCARLLPEVTKILAPVQGWHLGRDASLKSATFMLDLAEDALKSGNDTGDVKGTVSGLLASADTARNKVRTALAEADKILKQLEDLLREDFPMNAELAAINRSITQAGGDPPTLNMAELVDESSDVVDIMSGGNKADSTTTQQKQTEDNNNDNEDDDEDEDEVPQEQRESQSSAVVFSSPFSGDDDGNNDQQEVLDLTASVATDAVVPEEPLAPAPVAAPGAKKSYNPFA